jgi:hypothetical protein
VSRLAPAFLLEVVPAKGAAWPTMLSETPMPSVEEIESQAEFSVSVISAKEFEEVWRRATGEQSG